MKNTRKMMAFLIGITLLTISPAYADHDRAVTTETDAATGARVHCPVFSR